MTTINKNFEIDKIRILRDPDLLLKTPEIYSVGLRK